jgi:hypothetical protein
MREAGQIASGRSILVGHGCATAAAICMGNGEIGLCSLCIAIYFSPARHFLRVLQEDEALYVANITLRARLPLRNR